MTTIKLKLLGGRAEASVDGILTAGTVGLTARCSFDEAWDGLIPRLAVRCGGVERAAVIDGDGTAVIPWECLLGGEELYLSVDGWEESGVLRLPSAWVNCGRVAFSAVDCAPEEPEPTPEMRQQIYNMAKKASDEVAELRQDLEQWQEAGGSQGGGVPESALEGYAKKEWVREQGYLKEHQSLAGLVREDELAGVAKSGSYEDLTGKPAIPPAVTESTVAGWGFTKNSGTYSKPADGIPESDLSEDVRNKLNSGNGAGGGDTGDGIVTSGIYKTPYDYGGVGDGVHDDTAAIQALVENSNFCYFPIGLWRITQPIMCNRKTQHYPNMGHLHLKGDGGLLTMPTDITPSLLRTYSTAFSIIWGDFSAKDGSGNPITEERSVIDVDGTWVSFTAEELVIASTVSGADSELTSDPNTSSTAYHYMQTHTGENTSLPNGINRSANSATGMETVDIVVDGKLVLHLEEMRANVLKNGERIPIVTHGISVTRASEIRRCTLAGFSGAGINQRNAAVTSADGSVESYKPQHCKYNNVKLLSCYHGMNVMGHDHLLEYFWICRCHDAFCWNDNYNNSTFSINNTWADQLYGNFMTFQGGADAGIDALRINNCYIDLIGGQFITANPEITGNMYVSISNTRANKMCRISGDAAITAKNLRGSYIQIDGGDYNWLGGITVNEKPLLKVLGTVADNTIICTKRTPDYIFDVIPAGKNTVIDSSGIWMSNEGERYSMEDLLLSGAGEELTRIDALIGDGVIDV